ncbi:MAG: type II toxin-antitoxin system VapC family toxin [Deltaproteobacteria bacterium]|nr:type II toxin-antitoxin system VapC family toxin [Deltaproteobacteria bacterium]
MATVNRLLLDTHAFIWWLEGNDRLTKVVQELIADEITQVFISAATAWEISTKFRIGKLPGAAAVASDIFSCMAAQGFESLPISIEHAQRAGALPGLHRDPFDRMLAAQAQAENLPIASIDAVFDDFGVIRIW